LLISFSIFHFVAYGDGQKNREMDFRMVRDNVIEQANSAKTIEDAATILKDYQSRANKWKKSKLGNLKENEEALFYLISQEMIIIRDLDLSSLEASNCRERLDTVRAQFTGSSSEDVTFPESSSWMEKLLHQVCFQGKSPSSVKSKGKKK